jgi:high-affinity nickel-transport protein
VLDSTLATTADDGFRVGLVATAFVFGLRHGIDWDHLAAITDITGSQHEPRKSMLFATLYALGHGSVVFVLGIAAVFAGDVLPPSVDSVMEPVVGTTLLLLGVYVFYSLVRDGRDFRMRSRWMLVFSAARRAMRWIRGRSVPTVIEIEHDHEHPVDAPHHAYAHDRELVGAGAPVAPARSHRHRHRHVAAMPDDPFMDYGRATSFGVGMIHGVGAETPTQVLLFLAAVGAGGRGAGLVLLIAFLVGLLVTNSLIAIASTYGFLNAGRSFPVYASVAVLTGVFSIGVGAMFVLGRGEVLQAFFGG